METIGERERRGEERRGEERRGEERRGEREGEREREREKEYNYLLFTTNNKFSAVINFGVVFILNLFRALV